MGNFEKLSVLVIGVIIVMILVVALYTWTDDGSGDEATTALANTPAPDLPPENPRVNPTPGPDHAEDPWGPYERVLPVRSGPSNEDGPRVSDDPPVVDDPPVEEEEAVADTAARQYTVQEGDTLGGISLKVFGTTKYWQEIAKLNDVDPVKLRVDMTLLMPDIEAAAPPNKPGESTVASAGAPKPGSSYTVRSGDTIQRIAQAAYRTIERWPDIWFANMERLSTPEQLPVGLKLDIPN